VARVRPGTDRELRFTQTTEPDDPDEEPDGDDDQDAGTLPTSLDDLTTEADPQQFDTTFIAGDARLNIEGAFDPVAGSRQVIPRIAYVINYNMVWNPDRQRWEPKKKEADVGAGTTIDGFEDADLSEYGGDTGDFAVTQTSPVFDGDFSLKTASNNNSITSFSRLPTYPTRGDTFRYHIQISGSNAGGEMSFGAGEIDNDQYEAIVDFKGQKFRLNKNPAGSSGITLARTGAAIPADIWLRVRISWGTPTIALSLTRTDTGATIAEVSADDLAYDTGGVGFSSSQSNGSDVDIQWDLAELIP
jgi:hypothetical protein